MIELSVVTSLYRSAPYVAEFCQRASDAARSVVADAYEIVLVDDGSPDDSAEKALSIVAVDAHIRLVRLSRHFGHHRALAAGLAHSRGKYVFMIDCDLEEDPGLLVAFWREMQKEPSLDVVYGVQKSRRKGHIFERLSGDLFYALFSWLSDVPYAANQLTARLMTSAYVQHVLSYPEKEFDLWGLFSLAGFRQKAVPAVKSSKGCTTYTLSRKLAMAVEMISSFSVKPLFLIVVLGFLSTVFSLSIVAYLIFVRWMVKQPVPGWASITASIWLVGGLVLLSMGVIGMYISKIFLEVKQRPRYHISEVHDCSENTIS